MSDGAGGSPDTFGGLSNTFTSAGKQKMSQSSAIPSVIMPSEAKARWSRLSLKNTDENPATRTIVVMIIPVPTSANA